MSLPYWQQLANRKAGTQFKEAGDPPPKKDTKVGAKLKRGIKNKSNKTAARDRKLAKLYPIFLSTRPICRIQSPVCTRMATVVHHSRGRGAKFIFDQSTWIECCPPCNGYIEGNTGWAKEREFILSRHVKK